MGATCFGAGLGAAAGAGAACAGGSSAGIAVTLVKKRLFTVEFQWFLIALSVLVINIR